MCVYKTEVYFLMCLLQISKYIKDYASMWLSHFFLIQCYCVICVAPITDVFCLKYTVCEILLLCIISGKQSSPTESVDWFKEPPLVVSYVYLWLLNQIILRTLLWKAKEVTSRKYPFLLISALTMYEGERGNWWNGYANVRVWLSGRTRDGVAR